MNLIYRLYCNTKEERTYVNTDYIIQGDGQFNIQVMTPDKRDKMLAKKKKEAIQLAKMKLET